jgi:mannose-6-phosphate isomerase
MEPYPLLFEPILKARIWGGRALALLGKKLPKGELIGESWELADLPETVERARSIIANGELAGLTLRQAIERHRDLIMGDTRASGERFPLLIKFLDARENLSVQVHPTADYAAKHPEAHPKSEAWVVVHAEPGALIYKGVRPGVAPRQFAEHVRSGTVLDDLVAVPARVGDCHYLPAGTCHALGAGIVVAEIQTPSDTTFRVFDWNRTKAGPDRPLHVEQALECIHFGDSPDKSAKPLRPNKSIEVRGVKTTALVRSEYFEIDRVDAMSMARFSVTTSGLPEVWMLLGGSGRIERVDSARPAVELAAGTTALIPASLDGWHIALARAAWLLCIRLPSPLEGMIA